MSREQTGTKGDHGGTWLGKGGSMELCVTQRTENMDRKQITEKDYD
jgi:hypothetical protein